MEKVDFNINSTSKYVAEMLKTYNKNFSVHIKSGNYVLYLTKVLKNVAPYSKVGLAFSESSFSLLGKEIVKSIKDNGAKAVSFVYSESLDNTIENVAGFFDFPEDTRAVVVCDNWLIPFALYFCTVKKIPLIFIPIEPQFSEIFNSSVYIKSNNCLDCVSVDADRYFIIDTNLFSIDYSELFSDTFSGFSVVCDYVVDRAFCGKKPDARLLREIKQVFNDFNYKSVDTESIISASVKVEIITSLMAESKFYSALGFSKYLVKKKGKGFSLSLAFTLFKVYALLGVIKEEELILEDYLKRAEKISSTLKISFSLVLDWLKKQNSFYLKNKQAIMGVFNRLSKNFTEYASFEKVLRETYEKLGGKADFEKKNAPTIKKIIEMLGDVPFAQNGVTYFREIGAINSLK
jgi:hypothetical protein